MKSILKMVGLLLLISESVSAHILPMIYPGFEQCPLPKQEYFYIRIMPSPILDGFVSYELCPLIQDDNKDVYLIQSERQKLTSNNYYHDLILSNCQRPYQINSNQAPVYFDVRDLETVLEEDENREIQKMISVFFVAGVSAYFTGAVISPPLLGWIGSGVVGYLSSDIASQALEVAHPFQTDNLLITRMEYFLGAQSQGMDMYWPILPNEVVTFSECYDACNQKSLQTMALEPTSIHDLKRSLYSSNVVLKPTESITNQNPSHSLNHCTLSCRDKLIFQRKSIHDLWRSYFLKSIYQTGYQPNMYSRSIHHSNVANHSLESLMKTYHQKNGLSVSAWKPAMDNQGVLIPNHYTHQDHIIFQSFGSNKRYRICDALRINAFNNYKKTSGRYSYDQWLKYACHFDEHSQCREFFNSPIQTGHEICTILTEN